MLQSLLDSSTMPLLEKLAIFGERRQSVLAGNISNIDTPNYKSRDLPVEEFQEALKSAIQARNQASSPGTQSLSAQTSRPSIEELFPRELFVASEITPSNITFQDGNNRSVEKVNMDLIKNLMMQTFAVEVMHAQMNQLQTVISERL